MEATWDSFESLSAYLQYPTPASCSLSSSPGSFKFILGSTGCCESCDVKQSYISNLIQVTDYIDIISTRTMIFALRFRARASLLAFQGDVRKRRALNSIWATTNDVIDVEQGQFFRGKSVHSSKTKVVRWHISRGFQSSDSMPRVTATGRSKELVSIVIWLPQVFITRASHFLSVRYCIRVYLLLVRCESGTSLEVHLELVGLVLMQDCIKIHFITTASCFMPLIYILSIYRWLERVPCSVFW